MSSIREQILAEFRTRLAAPGGPAGLYVARTFTLAVASGQFPALSVSPGEESPVSKAKPLVLAVERTLIIAVDIFSQGVTTEGAETSPDHEADEILLWVEQQLTHTGGQPDRSLGGLVKMIEEHKTVWTGENGIGEYGQTQYQWRVEYHTKGGNQGAKL